MVVYLLAMSGKYKIEAILGSTLIGTYTVPCSQPHVEAANTHVVGGAAPSAFAGERYDLHVQARDQFGSAVKGGGAAFKAAVMDGDTVLFDAECDDNHDGKGFLGDAKSLLGDATRFLGDGGGFGWERSSRRR